MLRESVRETAIGYMEGNTRKELVVRGSVQMGEDFFQIKDLTVEGGESLAKERMEGLVRLGKADLIIQAITEEMDGICKFLGGEQDGLGNC